MVQIDESTRQQISAEETYRVEVRNQLEQRHSSRLGRILGVLNAPVSLWLLSTLAAGGISHLYNLKQHSMKQEAARRARQQLLAQEMWIRLGRLDAVTDRASLADLTRTLGGAAHVTGDVKRGYHGSHKVFRGVPMESLYLEFYNTLPRAQRSGYPNPDNLLRAIDHIRYHAAKSGEPSSTHPPFVSAMSTLRQLFRGVSLLLHGR